MTTLPTTQGNVTKMPTLPSPPSNMDCLCTDCEESQGRCSAKLSCFSLLKRDSKEEYVVTKGCIDTEMHFKAICENDQHLIRCCEGNLCNWNNTPPFPTEPPSKFIHIHASACRILTV